MTLSNRIADWLRGYAEAAGKQGFVLGLSGGVDSATVVGLAARAVGSEHVLTALLPIHSLPEDAELARRVAERFEILTIHVDLTPTFDALVDVLPPTDSRLAQANLKPRLRMLTLYYLAQSHDYLVLGTGNKSELMVGYFTKYGDGGADLLPLGGLYKTQVWELARDVGVPRAVVERAPSAGLWPGQTDEAEMGITYEQLDRVLQAIETGDTSNVDPTQLERVRRMVETSAHKRSMPPIFEP